MHTPFFALLVCEQFKEGGKLPHRRSDVLHSVTPRLVQRCAKARGLSASFKRLENAPGELHKQVLEVGKVAFYRLSRKAVYFFELENEDLSPGAVQLGFFEHIQATSPSKPNQYGFWHLIVQEYLAALYACSLVLKKTEDVEDLMGQLGCGAGVGHLSTFWVCVAGASQTDLHKALLCTIAKRGM